MTVIEFATFWQMWVVMAFIICVIFSYSYETVPMEITSVALVAFLLIFFSIFPVPGPFGQNLLGPGPLLKGFGNPALISIIGLLVVGQGLFQTGAFERPTRWLLELGGDNLFLKLVAVFGTVMVFSAFLNNTPVVVMFIPIISALATRLDRPTSRVMMPLSFICVLGGMTTLIGSSTNLLVADAYSKVSGDGIGFFDFTIPGLVLAFSGILYLAFGARYLLPTRKNDMEAATTGDGRQFIAQIELGYGHPLIGAKSIAGLLPDLPDMTVRMVQRHNQEFLPPFDDLTLRTGDSLIVAATRRTLTEFLTSHPDYLRGMVGPEFEESSKGRGQGGLNLVETVVAPGSRMVGRTLAQIGFYYQTNCVILGVQRRSRMIRSKMSEIRLQSGDVLLIFGEGENIAALRANRDILMLEWSAVELPTMSHANTARLIFGGVVLAAASSLVPVVVAAVAGAALMIWTGCLNIRQATRAVDQRIFLLIGATLALGLALDKTGGAQFLAITLVEALSGASIPIILSAFFLFVATLTNVLSNNATAVLMTPIAVSIAQQLGVDPLIFVYTVIFAANCSFATPIAYQTNLLVMGPGHYVFADYLRLGVPLVLIVWITYTLFAPWFFGISW